MKSIFSEDFVQFALALTVLMIANAASGVMKANKGGTFDWTTLRRGVMNYALWLLSATLTVAGCSLWGSDISFNIGTSQLTFVEAVDYAKTLVYGYWAGKAVQNFIEYSHIEKAVDPIDPQTVINTDTSVTDVWSDEAQG